ncbi:hypothetical protein SAMN04515668_1670 [Hymenobacter arizonensis]|uniref:Uncharacterized protein n=1 Tax=Hymenobacter arizonensis TaxID=1227077 RepID=A0A1I5X698_HYMAR|nr:hypothetical protein SAMN04515668_1670 [Hymenobacter arizonensis]
MTHFRFRHKRVGYMRWRRRAAGRCALFVVLPFESSTQQNSSTAFWRRAIPVIIQLQPLATVLHVGGFMVGEEGDPQLLGHPDIRY